MQVLRGLFREGKRDRDLESVQTLSERQNLTCLLGAESRTRLFRENVQLRKDYLRLRQK